MNRKTLMPILVLVSICVIVAALLGVVNSFTAPEIKAANAAKVKESLDIVMPDGSFGEAPDELRDNAPETVKEVYTDKNGKGHVVVLKTNKGYTGKDIGITVAIDTEGKIIKAVVTQNEESIVPPELKPMGSYGDSYVGADADTALDLVTGATVKFTESAIKNALYDAFTYLGYAEDRVLLGAYDLIPDAEEFEEVALDNTDGAVKRILRETSGKGQVIYTHTYAQHGGGLETETLIAVNDEGVITGIKKLSWVVGHNLAYGPPPPPSEEAVDAFFNRFVGKSLADIEEVELVTDATGTSMNVRVALTEALTLISAEEDGSLALRIVGALALVLMIGAFVTALIISRKRRAPYEK
jgi:plastocyanin